MNNWNDKLEFVNKLMTVAFKIGVLIGGFAICVYSWMIGYFPTGVTIGDGLLFILLATVTGLLISLFSFSFASLGVAMWPVWRSATWLLSHGLVLASKVTSKELTLGSFPTLRKAGVEHYGFALFGLLFAGKLAAQDWLAFTLVLALLFTSSVLWSTYKNNEEASIELLNSDKPDEDKKAFQKDVKRKNTLLLMAVIFMPLVITGAPSMLANGTMRISEVRIESAAVHIKQPYTAYATEYGVTGEGSNFGEGFLKFENAKVLFTGIGTNTVLSLINEKGKSVQLVVPNTSVHVLPVQAS